MIIVPAQSIPGNQHRWGRPVLRVLLPNSRSSFRSSTNWRRTTTKSLGGESLKTLNQDEVRKRCALVSQNSYFFNTKHPREFAPGASICKRGGNGIRRAPRRSMSLLQVCQKAMRPPSANVKGWRLHVPY